MKIGFIGLGNMGAALAQAVSQQADTQLLLSNHNPVKAHALQEKVGGQLFSNGEIAEQAEVIFLGVKPHLIQSVLSGLQDQISQNPSAIWISMAAGVTLNSLEEFVSADKLIRIMPNTPVAIGQGMTTYSVVNQELAPLLEQILEKSGKVQQVPEKLIDAATAIAGCGPAFV